MSARVHAGIYNVFYAAATNSWCLQELLSGHLIYIAVFITVYENNQQLISSLVMRQLDITQSMGIEYLIYYVGSSAELIFFPCIIKIVEIYNAVMQLEFFVSMSFCHPSYHQDYSVKLYRINIHPYHYHI